MAARGSSSGPAVHHLSFSLDKTAFACGNAAGFKTYHPESCKVIYPGPVFKGGGVKLVQMLASPEFVALVGDGASALYPRDKLLVWSEAHGKFIVELGFSGEILNLKYMNEQIVVVTLQKIHVFAFRQTPHITKVCNIDTGDNPLGLCAVSESASSQMVAFPVRDEGSLQITNLGASDGVMVNCHSNPLACFAFDPAGSLLVTASTKGTCIRIFNTLTGEQIREVRRGIDHSLIRYLCFSADGSRLLVSSDKRSSGTVHMFSLAEEDSMRNKHSKLFGLRAMLPSVFSSEWSFAQFHLDEPRSICAFGRDNDTFVVVAHSGTIYTCVVDMKAKHNCKLLTTGEFM